MILNSLLKNRKRDQVEVLEKLEGLLEAQGPDLDETRKILITGRSLDHQRESSYMRY